jgi:hypothetical protein
LISQLKKLKLSQLPVVKHQNTLYDVEFPNTSTGTTKNGYTKLKIIEPAIAITIHTKQDAGINVTNTDLLGQHLTIAKISSCY